MDNLFTTFRAIEKRRHQTDQRHRRRRAIIFSRFSRNIHNFMATVIQYTSNGLSTDLVVHQLIFLQLSSCTCIDSTPQIFISRLFRPIRHFNTMETSYTHAQLLSYPDLPQSSRAVPGYCNSAGSARYGTVLTGLTRQILTEPYRIVLARKTCVV